jgi:hypothetical protein
MSSGSLPCRHWGRIVARRLRNMVRELIGDQNKQDGKAFLKLYPVCVCLL